MEYLSELLSFVIHIDRHLEQIVSAYGTATYIILFIIVFCETGLVVTPILPGDSLLFAAGAIAARGNLSVTNLILTLIIAAILGDLVNYYVGNYIGPKVFERKDSRVFKREYLLKTQAFFDKYGGKAIILARFAPIVRTFAPFLAGVGKMNYSKFALYNITGAVAWVSLFVLAGYLFSELPVVKNNFSLVIMGIIVVSLLPIAFEFIKARRSGQASA